MHLQKLYPDAQAHPPPRSSREASRAEEFAPSEPAKEQLISKKTTRTIKAMIWTRRRKSMNKNRKRCQLQSLELDLQRWKYRDFSGSKLKREGKKKKLQIDQNSDSRSEIWDRRMTSQITGGRRQNGWDPKVCIERDKAHFSSLVLFQWRHASPVRCPRWQRDPSTVVRVRAVWPLSDSGAHLENDWTRVLETRHVYVRWRVKLTVQIQRRDPDSRVRRRRKGNNRL